MDAPAASAPAKARRSALWQLGIGLCVGAATGALAAVATQLSPLALADRNALSLIAVSISLPLGVMLAFFAGEMRDVRHVALRALAGAVGLALAVSALDARLMLVLLLWLAPAMLCGACLAALDRRGVTGFVVVLLWFALCASPFFCGVFEGTALADVALQWSMQGCPWMGFVNAALGQDAPMDPLRRHVIYMGHWSPLTAYPAQGLLTSETLWWLAALALGNLLVRRAWSVELGARSREN